MSVRQQFESISQESILRVFAIIYLTEKLRCLLRIAKLALLTCSREGLSKIAVTDRFFCTYRKNDKKVIFLPFGMTAEAAFFNGLRPLSWKVSH